MISQQKQIPNRDPFYVEPLPKAHYYPTKKKTLSETQKRTAISPNRKSTTTKKQEKERLSYNDELFLKGSNSFTPKPSQDDSGSSKFDESWPSTDRPLSVADDDHPLNEYLHGGDRLTDLKQTLQFTDKDGRKENKDSSTLQKYIERFRTGQPTSRQERQKGTSSQNDFWWLGEGSVTDSSTPKDSSPGAKRTKRFTPHSPMNPYKGQGERRENGMALTPSKLDHTTRQLQEKADRLLDSASSVASSDPIVSTDGLGSSLSFNSTVSSVEEKPFRPSFARKWEKQDKPSYQIPKPQGRQPSGPEDDVLYQWRLRRRMEQARDSASKAPAVKFGYRDKSPAQKEIDQKLGEFKQRLAGKEVQPTVDDIHNGPPTDSPRHHGAVLFTPAPQPSHIHQQTSYPVASPSLPKKGGENIEPHFHLTCDLLPCSHRNVLGNEVVSSEQTDKSKTIHENESGKNIPDNNEGTYSDKEKISQDFKNFEDSCCEKDTNADRYKFLEAEKPDIEKKDNVDSESEHGHEQQENEENSPNIDDNVSCKSEKSSRSVDRRSESSHKSYEGVRDRKGEPSSTSSKEKTQKDKRSPPPVVKQTGKPVHSKNVDSTIGAVVKDRLFNISASTVVSSMDSEASSPPRKSLGKKVMENQEDEDYESDGEFGDDQLLCMLRQQRAQFEDQLKHIDNLLSRLDPD